MKNKGFTLVELLGVIVLLGVLSLVAIVSINGTLKENRENLYNIQIENIESGAKNWASKNVFSLPDDEGESIYLTLGQLQENGFVEKDIKNPVTDELFSISLNVKITKVGNNYTYEVMD